MLTFQKEYSNLEKNNISKRMNNDGSSDVDRYNAEKKLELEIQKIIEENILKSKYPNKKEKDYITSLILKIPKNSLFDSIKAFRISASAEFFRANLSRASCGEV